MKKGNDVIDVTMYRHNDVTDVNAVVAGGEVLVIVLSLHAQLTQASHKRHGRVERAAALAKSRAASGSNCRSATLFAFMQGAAGLPEE